VCRKRDRPKRRLNARLDQPFATDQRLIGVIGFGMFEPLAVAASMPTLAHCPPLLSGNAKQQHNDKERRHEDDALHVDHGAESTAGLLLPAVAAVLVGATGQRLALVVGASLAAVGLCTESTIHGLTGRGRCRFW
jgi:hypothetical protein